MDVGMVMLLYLLVWLGITVASSVALVVFLAVDARQVRVLQAAARAEPRRSASAPDAEPQAA